MCQPWSGLISHWSTCNSNLWKLPREVTACNCSTTIFSRLEVLLSMTLVAHILIPARWSLLCKNLTVDGRTGKFEGQPKSCFWLFCCSRQVFLEQFCSMDVIAHSVWALTLCDGEDTTETEKVLRTMGAEFVVLSRMRDASLPGFEVTF